MALKGKGENMELYGLDFWEWLKKFVGWGK